MKKNFVIRINTRMNFSLLILSIFPLDFGSHLQVLGREKGGCCFPLFLDPLIPSQEGEFLVVSK